MFSDYDYFSFGFNGVGFSNSEKFSCTIYPALQSLNFVYDVPVKLKSGVSIINMYDFYLSLP